MSLSNAQSVVVASAMTGALINGLTGRSIIGGAINGAISGVMVAGVGKVSDSIFGTEIMSRGMTRNFNTSSKIGASGGIRSFSSSIGRSANTSNF